MWCIHSTNAHQGPCPLLHLEKKTWSRRRPSVAYMHVFKNKTYAMILDEKRGKVDANGTKCVFLGYCKGMKAYRLMYMKMNKS